MENLKMHSHGGVQRNIELIGMLFPNAITVVKRGGKVEYAIDFNVLRQRLFDSIMEGREKRLYCRIRKRRCWRQCAHYGNVTLGCGGQREQEWNFRWL